jgi:hypothetical protein
MAKQVGTVKMVSAEAIRILLWVLGFLSFGYGTREFEVTGKALLRVRNDGTVSLTKFLAERLGCYRPEGLISLAYD